MTKYNIGEGDTVVDVGAGTGLFLDVFSKLVGESGRVHAVEIIPKFVHHMQMRVNREKIQNVSVSRCTPKSTNLEEYFSEWRWEWIWVPFGFDFLAFWAQIS